MQNMLFTFQKYSAFVITTFLCMLSLTTKVSDAIYCYECDSFDDFTCTEIWDAELDVNSLYLSNCSHVSDAKYCIKMTGIYQVNKLYSLYIYTLMEKNALSRS